ncbi:HupE/UreJ family protein [Synechococcus sp. CBW1002]|jgi:urease accessory protein|uniref:HupE/UreJ family protein n=1 Tax=Synechococcus sp. CBW1002 TaxID=1353134 RepID=UPI0018CD4BB8|nr:HupE/UreJ family protein [Synechococcus sp. CBW1002]QPN60764.1 HupE/UreJ family protein [Synechococcus sp. CBW1002]
MPACLAMLLLDQPAQADGIAQGSIAACFLHPPTGADHLLLLIGVGAAAAPADGSAALWWLGAFGASLLVNGGGFLLLALCGGVIALEPIGLLVR